MKTTQTKRRGLAGLAIGIIFLLVLTAVGVLDGIDAYYTDVQFNNKIGGYFDLADQSSNATVKLQYWNQFSSALKQYDLNKGLDVQTGGWPMCACASNPEYNLTNAYNTNVLTIQSRLQSLVDSCPSENITCQSTYNYSYTLSQIELNEICWFPLNYFQQGYEMHDSVAFFGPGVPFAGWSAPTNAYLCSTATQT